MQMRNKRAHIIFIENDRKKGKKPLCVRVDFM